jgi:nucleotide-binding universal stress UspA family protein
MDFDRSATSHDPDPGCEATLSAAVVVGVDGSDESCRAAVLGHSIAEARAVPFYLLAAATNTLLEVAAVELGLELDQLDEALLDRAEAVARDSLTGVLPAGVIDSALKARVGRSEHVLSEFAHEVDAGLVVVGGRRHTAPMGWFPRGTAQHLARGCTTPILITAAPPADPEIHRVLLALDFSEAASRVVEFGLTLAANLDIPVEAVHVADARPLSVESPVGLAPDAWLEAHESRAALDLWPLLPESTARRVVIGSIPEALADVAAERPGSIVVVGSHGLGQVNRLLLGSTTDWLLDRLPSAVAVVPAYREVLR